MTAIKGGGAVLGGRGAVRWIQELPTWLENDGCGAWRANRCVSAVKKGRAAR